MTTFIVLAFVLFTLIVAGIFILAYRQSKLTPAVSPIIEETIDNRLKRITSLNWQSKFLLWAAFIMVVFSFIAPFLFTRQAASSDFIFSETGQIGDTIGGLMNPFISMSGVVVTGLAFYIQFRANELQRQLFLSQQAETKKDLQDQINSQRHENSIQQFESQFYEMLNLHRANITEMKIEGYDFKEISSGLERFDKITEGRKIFVTMKTELEFIIAVFAKDRSLNDEVFQKCYKLFFSGIDEFKRSFPEETIMAKLFEEARSQHQNSKWNLFSNIDRKLFKDYPELNFNYKPFSGHASRLGHYFRHLYLTVKSVANSTVITDYSQRMRYLKILRAQLSNHEQILLFYNWLSTYGSPWENEEHKFFTEYRMIHNLWYDNLFSNRYIIEKVNYLKKIPVQFREGEMFEVDE